MFNNIPSALIAEPPRQPSAHLVLELLEEVAALSQDVRSTASSRLAPLQLDVPTGIGAGEDAQVAMPPYFDILRSRLQVIRDNLYATHDAVVRCEI